MKNEAGGRLIRHLLRIPLFYKILVANSAIVLVGTVVGTLSTRAVIRMGAGLPVEWVLSLAAAGVLVTMLVNVIILRVALSPLKLLEQTAARVQDGDLSARVPYSVLRDRELERLTGTFNRMLDALESYRQRLVGIAARALDAEEQERKRIARELHDDTAQTLAALLIRLRLVRGVEDPEEREAAFDQFREDVGAALERIRLFARGLRPPALDELGLVPALESHVRALAESVQITMRVEADAIEDLLTSQAELALYRIAQEAISNAIRHAAPKQVILRIQRLPHAIALTVNDDGQGFLVDEMMTSKDRGLGLFGMKERAGYLGGQVSVWSRPGRGTEVRAVVPTGTSLNVS